MLSDPNNEPQYGERVPYVIIKGPPGSRLVDRAIDPLELVQNRCYIMLILARLADILEGSNV